MIDCLLIQFSLQFGHYYIKILFQKQKMQNKDYLQIQQKSFSHTLNTQNQQLNQIVSISLNQQQSTEQKIYKKKTCLDRIRKCLIQLKHSKIKITILVFIIIILSVILVLFLIFLAPKKVQYIQSSRQVSSQVAIYKLIKLQTNSSLCLDGSPGSYYLSTSPNEVSQNVMIYFNGGGWCSYNYLNSYISNDQNQIFQQCYQRSKTFLGSSKYYENQIERLQGITSNHPQNPFRSWKKVIINYCDGAGHQGTRKQPIYFNGQRLYFRGYNITVSIFEDLQKNIKIFSKAQKVVVSGSSAGGAAVFYWTNYLFQKLKNMQYNIKVKAVSDSGIFINSLIYKQRLNKLLAITNSQIDIPVPQCIAQFGKSSQKCFVAENLYKHMKVPLFMVQSVYCADGLSFKNCKEEDMLLIEEHRKNISNVIQNIYNHNNFTQSNIQTSIDKNSSISNSIWSISCAGHAYCQDSSFSNSFFSVPQKNGNTISQAIKKWLNDQNNTLNHYYKDYSKWPQHITCSGL